MENLIKPGKFLHSKGNHEEDEKTTLEWKKIFTMKQLVKGLILKYIQGVHLAHKKQLSQKIGIIPQKTFFQWHTDGQETHETFSSIHLHI